MITVAWTKEVCVLPNIRTEKQMAGCHHTCYFSKSAVIVKLHNFCAKGCWGLEIICQGFSFQCDYLKDTKHPFESKCAIISAQV